MKVLLCHNYYQQPGGEDQAFHDEGWLLESHGHDVLRYTVHNDVIEGMSACSLAGKMLWNRDVYRELRSLIRREHPDVMHCTNTFPLISPSAYYAARREGVPVVQSLHNYRLLCPNALLLRDGRVCEDCVGKATPLPAIRHGCYRRSRLASGGVATMLRLHRGLQTWSRAVDLYIALTEFGRGKFIEGGLPADKIVVKPNFVYPDAGMGDGLGGYAIFVGRLSEEKGIATLLDAWKELAAPVELRIVGDGPLADRVSEAAEDDPRIRWLGHRSKEEVVQQIGDAACLICPSICYETFGRTIIEAFARGVPVIASNIGAMAELVTPRETGLLVPPGDARELAGSVATLLDDKRQLATMRDTARVEFETHYSADTNYQLLDAAYRRLVSADLPELVEVG